MTRLKMRQIPIMTCGIFRHILSTKCSAGAVRKNCSPYSNCMGKPSRRVISNVPDISHNKLPIAKISQSNGPSNSTIIEETKH